MAIGCAGAADAASGGSTDEVETTAHHASARHTLPMLVEAGRVVTFPLFLGLGSAAVVPAAFAAASDAGARSATG
jgi:hypothetical protein